MQENTHQRTARMLRRAFVVAVVVLLAGGALAGCSDGGAAPADVSSDPETLSRAVVEASYARDYGFLWSHTSPLLKDYYNNDLGDFRQQTEERLDYALRDGAVDAHQAETTYADYQSSVSYSMKLSDPTGNPVTFAVTLQPTTPERNQWTYCQVGFEDPTVGGHTLIGELGQASCY